MLLVGWRGGREANVVADRCGVAHVKYNAPPGRRVCLAPTLLPSLCTILADRVGASLGLGAVYKGTERSSVLG
jgi:hypothetical protein